jgi:anti-anti-sigma regulatory factor
MKTWYQMAITIQEVQSRVPVTIMQLHGELDASHYLDVIAQARELYAAGTRHLLLDLSDLSFMASAGLRALHSIALIMRGEEPPDAEHSRKAAPPKRRGVEGGLVQEFKILNPQPPVNWALEVSGFKTFLEVYTDLETALASF